MTRVHVGIPTVGRVRYLEEAVESVLGQSLTDFRLVVSEDGPGSEDVARRLRPYLVDTRVELRPLGARRGAVANMNAILATADAPYVAILHDDDVWEPTFLERRVAYLDGHPDSGFVFSGCTLIDQDGGPLVRKLPALPEGENRVEAFLPLMLESNRVPTCSLLVRRAAYDTVGPFDPEFPAIYDYEMSLRLASRFPSGYLRISDVRWRLHGSQATYDPGYLRSSEYERLLRRIDEIVPAAVRPPVTLRRRNLGDRLLVDALNAACMGDRRRAARHLAAALAKDPRALTRARTAATVAGIVLGSVAPKLLPPAAGRARRLRLRLLALRS